MSDEIQRNALRVLRTISADANAGKRLDFDLLD